MPPGLSQASLGPSGPGPQGPTAAVQAVQDMAAMNQQQSQKAMQRIVALQQEMARAQQEQAQQVQGGVAEIANQVAGGLQRMQDEKTQREQMAEKTRTSEDLMIFQQKLAQQATKEGERIGLAMRQAQQATMSAVDVWKAKGEQMKANHNGVFAAFNQMVQEGAFENIPNGYQKMADIQKALRMSEAYVEDHTDPSYLSHATNLLQQAERDIAEGRDPMDLAAMYATPKTPAYEGVEPTGKSVDSLPGEERFAMMLRGGYPEEGLFAMAEDDPRREHTNIVTPDVMARLLVDNATMSGLVTHESRKKFIEYRMRSLHEADARYQQYSEQYTKINSLMQSRAPEAVRMGIEDFMASGDTTKFTNPGKRLFSSAIKAMFPEGGEEIAKLAEGVRNRTVQIDTAVEFSNAATLEAAALAIEQRANEGLAVETGKNTALSEMASDYAKAIGPEAVAHLWGRDAVDRSGELTGVGMVRAQRAMQKSLEGLKAFAGEVKQAANEVGALEGFRKEFGTNSRLTDIYLYNYLNAQGEQKAKAKELLYGSVQQEADTLALEDLDKLSVAPTEETKTYRNILDSTLEMIQAVGPSQLPKLAALLSGGQVDLTDGNIAKFNAGTASVAERSAYLQLTLDAMKDSRDIQKEVSNLQAQGVQVTPDQVLQMSKEKSNKRAEKAKSLEQTFQETGALGVVGRGIAATPATVMGGLQSGVEGVSRVGYGAGSLIGGQMYRDLIESLAERIATQGVGRNDQQQMMQEQK